MEIHRDNAVLKGLAVARGIVFSSLTFLQERAIQ
jgi:hypothetical protein